MQKVLFILSLSLLFSFAEINTGLKSKLLEVFNTEQVETIMNTPSQAKYFNALVFDSYKIESLGKKQLPGNYPVLNQLELKTSDGKTEVITKDELIEAVKKGTFNPLRLKMERELDKVKTFRLGTSNLLFHLYSHTQINTRAKQ